MLKREALVASLKWGDRSVTVSLTHTFTNLTITKEYYPNEQAIQWTALIEELDAEVYEFLRQN